MYIYISLSLSLSLRQGSSTHRTALVRRWSSWIAKEHLRPKIAVWRGEGEKWGWRVLLQVDPSFQTGLKGGNGKGVVASACLYIVSPFPPNRHLYCHISAVWWHPCPCYSITKLRATIACWYTVGACCHCDIVLSSRSPRKCRYPLFAYPLLKPAQSLQTGHTWAPDEYLGSFFHGLDSSRMVSCVDIVLGILLAPFFPKFCGKFPEKILRESPTRKSPAKSSKVCKQASMLEYFYRLAGPKRNTNRGPNVIGRNRRGGAIFCVCVCVCLFFFPLWETPCVVFVLLGCLVRGATVLSLELTASW